MMRPLFPRASIAPPTIFVPRKQLVRFRSICLCHVSSYSVSIGTLTSRLPTLLIRMSIGPISSRIRSHACWQSAGTPISTFSSPRLSSTRPNLPGRLVERFLRSTGDDDIRAGISQRERHQSSQPAARASHDRTLAIETKEIERSHVQPPSTSSMLTGRRSASDFKVASIIAVTMTPSRPPASGITSSAMQSTK